MALLRFNSVSYVELLTELRTVTWILDQGLVRT